jgi:hypothetical protein
MVCAAVMVSGAVPAAQEPSPPDAQTHQHAAGPEDAASTPGWTGHVDGVVFGTFNNQGGRRGDTDFRSQNWFMVMGTRPLGPGIFSTAAMLSAEPFTVGSAGYSEIFQEGESYHGLQITDRQHPHDVFMQLSAAWRVPLGDRSSVTFAGGPVGEAALGPVPFMHRPSSRENPTAPLSHHVFDSTHIVHGVATIRADHGPVAVETSAFYGREPDEHRYDLEFGPLDSWSVRAWVTPSPDWTIQVSHGFLHQPELLEPGNQRRTNASVSWFKRRPSGFTAAIAAVGWNERQYSTVGATLVELTQRTGLTSLYTRFERTTVETEILLLPQIIHVPHPGELVDPIVAFTAGGIRDFARFRGLTMGGGGDVVFYGVPPLLQVTHGSHPVSFHLFVRLTRASWEGKMMNGTMAAPEHSGPGHVH